MTKGLVIYIEEGDDQRVEVWTDETLRVGVTPDCDVRVRDSIWEAAGASLLLTRRNSGRYHLVSWASQAPIRHRQELLTPDLVIDDGGIIRVEDSPLSVRFLVFNPASTSLIAPRKTVVAPFISEAALEAAESPERSDAIFFVRELSRELWRELRFRTKFALIAMPLILLLGVMVFGIVSYRERRRGLSTISEQKRQLDEQERQIGDMKRRMGETDERIAKIDDSRRGTEEGIQGRLNLAQRLARDYNRGVCLITGVYQLLDPATKQPLRYPEPTLNEDGEVVTSAGAPPVLTTEGNGTLAEYEFVGTGFYVGGDYILTNRHVVQPWTANNAQNGAGRPNIKFLKAYFPGRHDALTLKVKLTATNDDLAVCTIVPERSAGLVPLPLDTQTDALPVGAEAILMGYPSGPDRLMALLKESEAIALQRRYGSSLDALLHRLAELNLVRPLITQGHVTDTHKDRIIFDAATSEGGSGGPIFGPSGAVVGISFGVFTENTGSNFGVPVANILPFLSRAGWQAPPNLAVAATPPAANQ